MVAQPSEFREVAQNDNLLCRTLGQLKLCVIIELPSKLVENRGRNADSLRSVITSFVANMRPQTPMKSFKSEHSFEKRKQLAMKIRTMYTDRLPIIVEKAPNSQVPDICKKKFLAPADMTVQKFLLEIKKQLQPSSYTDVSQVAIFLFVDKTVLPPSGHLMSQMYDKHKDEDGFLYITYSGENTFG